MNILKSVKKMNLPVNMSVKELVREWNIWVKEWRNLDFLEIFWEIENQNVFIFQLQVFFFILVVGFFVF